MAVKLDVITTRSTLGDLFTLRRTFRAPLTAGSTMREKAATESPDMDTGAAVWRTYLQMAAGHDQNKH